MFDPTKYVKELTNQAIELARMAEEYIEKKKNHMAIVARSRAVRVLAAAMQTAKPGSLILQAERCLDEKKDHEAFVHLLQAVRMLAAAVEPAQKPSTLAAPHVRVGP